ncbi:hypothetical protein GGS24DRAFT_467904 [Hypoxylon argillaceum]|nr:hypothetical protein GGS24DRAFT_467904 [Hypoxylon argillaceum]
MSRFQRPLSPPIPNGLDGHNDTRIEFFHPAYPNLVNPLLTFPAVDVAGDGRIGIDFDTARVACGIVACNRWDDDAYFAVKSHEQGKIIWTKIERPDDGVLCADTIYYFVVDEPDHRYPVVPSFDHWRFPHGALPPLWAKLSIPDINRYIPPANDWDYDTVAHHRDVSCRVTGCFEGVKVAHILPFSHDLWFRSNRMDGYCRIPHVVNPIGDQTNLLLLRADIHNLYDQNRFAFIPKDATCNGPESIPTLLLHAILTKGSPEISQYYHNRPLQSPIVGIRREHLFARFALSILCEENYRFLSGMHKYAVRLFDTEKGEQYTDELYSDAIIQRSKIFPPARRTWGPRKRKTFSSPQPRELYEEDDSSWDEETSVEYPSDSEQRPRGRARLRSPGYYKTLVSQ